MRQRTRWGRPRAEASACAQTRGGYITPGLACAPIHQPFHMNRRRWAAVFFSIAGVVAVALVIARGATARLPIEAVTVLGYTNVDQAEPGWLEGWHVVLAVTNGLAISVECLAGSQPRFTSDTEVWSAHPAEKGVDPHT